MLLTLQIPIQENGEGSREAFPQNTIFFFLSLYIGQLRNSKAWAISMHDQAMSSNM